MNGKAAWGIETHLGNHWDLLRDHYLLYLASLGWIQGSVSVGTLWRSHFECGLSTSSTSSWSCCEPWFNLRLNGGTQETLEDLNRGSEASELKNLRVQYWCARSYNRGAS